MSLRGWQSGLAALVQAHAANHHGVMTPCACPPGIELGDGERDWLNQVASAPGFRLTCSIQRSWREVRLKSSARFTLMAVPAELRAGLLSGWLDSHVDTSFFYAREATAFLDYVLDRLPDQPHLVSICRFERAVLACAASLTTFAPDTRGFCQLPAGTWIARHDAASLVDFSAPPEAVFEALLAGSSLPSAEQCCDRFSLLIAPGLTRLCRRASAIEQALWDRCSLPIRPRELCQAGVGVEGIVEHLLSAGALTTFG